MDTQMSLIFKGLFILCSRYIMEVPYAGFLCFYGIETQFRRFTMISLWFFGILTPNILASREYILDPLARMADCIGHSRKIAFFLLDYWEADCRINMPRFRFTLGMPRFRFSLGIRFSLGMPRFF